LAAYGYIDKWEIGFPECPKPRENRTNNHTSAAAGAANNKGGDHLAIARRVLQIEQEGLATVAERIDGAFSNAVALLEQCTGKIIVTGLGKSGIAARKIAATFASTGAPALFMHSAEAIHGDMGVASQGDVAICLSYSGETAEVNALIPRLKLKGIPVISITGNRESTMAQHSDCVLDVAVPSYPFPFGLIPTASYTATVAIGDALALALMTRHGVTQEDFALLHPGGLLGQKMLVKVQDLMHTGDNLPKVLPAATMRQALVAMTSKRLGTVCVTDEDDHLLGIITDGDLRRILEKVDNPFSLSAGDVMTPNPRAIHPNALAATALHQMERRAITSLAVLDTNRQLVGLIHIHDIIKLETSR